MSSSASTLAGAGGGASAGGPGPSGARAGDDDYPQDQVKVYSHEGDGENTEHLISMDLHDVKTEMAKDAENAETPKNAANASSSTVQTPTTTAALAGLRPLIQHPTMVYANGTFMMPPFPAGTPIYPVMRPVKMEAGSDWKVSQGQISIPAYSYPAGFLPTMEHGSLRPATAYPFMIPGPYVAAATPYQHQLTTLGQPVAPNATVSPHSGMVAPQVKEKKQHIKKPLNAFMLFMKEKRADVIKECTLKESAAINQILGKMWHALDRSEQAKYYEMAREERAKHMQMYPGWSARDNYAVHKKRRKRKTKTVDGSKQSPTATIAGGASTTDDQDSHNTSNDNNDIDDPNARKCRARFGLDQQHLWCNPCKRKKKCTKFSEDEDDSAPKAYHGELEDDVISNDTKNSSSVVGDKVPLRSGGVADAMTTKTTVQSETSSHGNGQMDRSVSQSEQRVMHAPITLQTIPST